MSDIHENPTADPDVLYEAPAVEDVPLTGGAAETAPGAVVGSQPPVIN